MTLNKKQKLTNHFINGDKKTNYIQDFIYIIFFIFEILNDKKAKPDNFILIILRILSQIFIKKVSF